MQQVLDRATTQTVLDYPPVCGQCRFFVAARTVETALFGTQIRPSYCRLLAMSDCDSTRKVASDCVCNQYEEAIPF